MTKRGIVTEVKANEPDRVKTDTCPGKFRKVSKLVKRSSTLTNSNDIES